MSLQDVSDLLKLLNEVELTTVDERRLKQAFHEKFYPISVSPIMLLNVRHQYVSMELTVRKHFLSLLAVMKLISLLLVLCSISQTCMLSANFHVLYFFFQSAANVGNYLEYQNFQYDQWRYILKVLYKKVGLFKEAMDLQIKEVCVF